jgi:hypothetical protein
LPSVQTTAAPAINWREEAQDEATRYEDYALILAWLPSAATQRIGRAGRALHRKGHLTTNSITVLRDVDHGKHAESSQ